MKTDLGVTDEHVSAMQMKIDALERANDWIGNTPIRHAVSERLVEIRLLLRDGHLKNKNGGKTYDPDQPTSLRGAQGAPAPLL